LKKIYLLIQCYLHKSAKIHILGAIRGILDIFSVYSQQPTSLPNSSTQKSSFSSTASHSQPKQKGP
jgi:hypothetical protein